MAGISTPPSTESFLPKPTLDSWKEIALYLNRGVRTVQRWEQALHLPVYRIGKSERGHVFAYRLEIDKWLETCARNPQYSAELTSDTVPGLTEIRSSKHDVAAWEKMKVSTESILNGTEKLNSLIQKLQNLMRQNPSSPLKNPCPVTAD